jgi:hypothetical protein
LIERTGIPGEKGIYYRLRDDSFAELLRSRMSLITDFKNTLDKGLSLVPDSDKGRYTRLQEIRDFYDFCERKFPELLEMWSKERNEVNNTKNDK